MAIFTNENLLIEAELTKRYFRLSLKNSDGEVIKPSIPNNYLTAHGYEDDSTARVCFAPTINHCLMAMSRNVKGQEFFVMIPDGNYSIYKPTSKEVPDSVATKEVWITEPVKVKCIGKIKVISDDGKDGYKYTYGNGKEAELYGWKYKWFEKFDSSVNEALINQWWDRTKEAQLRDRHNREEREANRREEEEAAKNDESHLKEYGIITQKEFDVCFSIAKKEFVSHRRLSYASSFKPSNYKYYKCNRNDFIRFIITEYKDYFKSEDESVWKDGMKEFKHMIKKAEEKINDRIKAIGIEGVSFYSEDLYEAMYFYLGSNRPKED